MYVAEGQWSSAAFPDGQDGAASLVEEIRLLIEMVVEHALPWLESLLADGHGTAHAGERSTDDESDPDRDQVGEPACDWCPLCAVVALAHGRRPEFAVRVFDEAARVVALLRAVLADRWQPDDGVHMPGFRPSAPENGTDTARRGDAEPTGGRVQHIPVRRREDWDTGAR